MTPQELIDRAIDTAKTLNIAKKDLEAEKSRYNTAFIEYEQAIGAMNEYIRNLLK